MAKECASELVRKRNDEAVLQFTASVEKRLSMIVEQSFAKTTGKHSSKREKMWSEFHKFRSHDLFSIWNRMVEELNIQEKFRDMWLPQTVARLALESIVKSKCPAAIPQTAPQLQLDGDELNALRYVAGFVLLSVKKAYVSIGATTIANWIDRQVDSSVSSADSYQEFSNEWIKKVNRGGLFCVCDAVFDLFVAMEKQLRLYLADLSAHHGIDKDKVLTSILQDDEVQLLWEMLVMELTEEEEQSLLRKFVQLWLTIRGFSYASAIKEEYKRSCGALKRKRALRKELKKKSLED